MTTLIDDYQRHARGKRARAELIEAAMLAAQCQLLDVIDVQSRELERLHKRIADLELDLHFRQRRPFDNEQEAH